MLVKMDIMRANFEKINSFGFHESSSGVKWYVRLNRNSLSRKKRDVFNSSLFYKSEEKDYLCSLRHSISCVFFCKNPSKTKNLLFAQV